MCVCYNPTTIKIMNYDNLTTGNQLRVKTYESNEFQWFPLHDHLKITLQCKRLLIIEYWSSAVDFPFFKFRDVLEVNPWFSSNRSYVSF